MGRAYSADRSSISALCYTVSSQVLLSMTCDEACPSRRLLMSALSVTSTLRIGICVDRSFHLALVPAVQCACCS